MAASHVSARAFPSPACIGHSLSMCSLHYDTDSPQTMRLHEGIPDIETVIEPSWLPLTSTPEQMGCAEQDVQSPGTLSCHSKCPSACLQRKWGVAVGLAVWVPHGAMLCAVESQGSFLTRRACARWHVVIAWMPWDWVGLHWGCIHGHALCTTHLSCSAITQIAAAQAHARSPSSVHFDKSHHLARTHMQHARGTPLQRSLPCHTHFHRRCLLCSLPDALSQKMLLCSLPDALSQKMPAVQSAMDSVRWQTGPTRSQIP